MCTTINKTDTDEYLDLLFQKESGQSLSLEEEAILQSLSSDPTMHNRAVMHVAKKMNLGEDLSKAELAFRVSNPRVYLIKGS